MVCSERKREIEREGETSEGKQTDETERENPVSVNPGCLPRRNSENNKL